MRSFKSNENIHKKEGGSYYVVSANKTFQKCNPPGFKFYPSNLTNKIFPHMV